MILAPLQRNGLAGTAPHACAAPDAPVVGGVVFARGGGSFPAGDEAAEAPGHAAPGDKPLGEAEGAQAAGVGGMPLGPVTGKGGSIRCFRFGHRPEIRRKRGGDSFEARVPERRQQMQGQRFHKSLALHPTVEPGLAGQRPGGTVPDSHGLAERQEKAHHRFGTRQPPARRAIVRPNDAGGQKHLKQRVHGAGVAQQGRVEQRQRLPALFNHHLVERRFKRKISSQFFKTSGIHAPRLLQC